MALDDYLAEIARNRGFAPPDRTITEAFQGLNIIGRNSPIPTNTENHGLTFFTRPDMNMSYDNLAVDRVLSNMLSDNPRSVSRMLRGYFDKRLVDNGLNVPGIDNRNAFIPLLSNNLVSLSGFPDITLNTNTSPPGLYKEEYSYVDDVPYLYQTYDLQASFRNIEGDPITFLFLTWAWYMGLVYEGRLMPYPDNVLFNRVDYQSRVYRLVLDRSRKRVVRIACANVVFPTGVPTGNIFNFEAEGSESPFPDAAQNISMNFRAIGMRLYDNLIIHEFNTVVGIFNPTMKDDRREDEMQLLKHYEYAYFNYTAYPRVNPENNDMEWWVDKPVYQAKMGNVVQTT